MSFAYDIVLLDKFRSGVNAKVEFWQSALKSKGFLIRLDGQEILKSDNILN